MTHHKVYTPEFKHQAVQLAKQSGNTNQGIANDLGPKAYPEDLVY